MENFIATCRTRMKMWCLHQGESVSRNMDETKQNPQMHLLKNIQHFLLWEEYGSQSSPPKIRKIIPHLKRPTGLEGKEENS